MTLNNKELTQLSNEMQGEDLLKKVINQLNKDANLSGIDFNLNQNSTALSIANKLNDLISDLIKNDFSSYLNFLYRVDISETDLINIQDMDLNDLSKIVTVLILKKEWGKVWLKNNFKNKSQ